MPGTQQVLRSAGPEVGTPESVLLVLRGGQALSCILAALNLAAALAHCQRPLLGEGRNVFIHFFLHSEKMEYFLIYQ